MQLELWCWWRPTFTTALSRMKLKSEDKMIELLLLVRGWTCSVLRNKQSNEIMLMLNDSIAWYSLFRCLLTMISFFLFFRQSRPRSLSVSSWGRCSRPLTDYKLAEESSFPLDKSGEQNKIKEALFSSQMEH